MWLLRRCLLSPVRMGVVGGSALTDKALISVAVLRVAVGAT